MLFLYKVFKKIVKLARTEDGKYLHQLIKYCSLRKNILKSCSKTEIRANFEKKKPKNRSCLRPDMLC